LDAGVEVDPDADGLEPPSDAAPTPSGELVYSRNVRTVVMPSDNGAALLAAVKAAQTSVVVEMYIFTNVALIDALIARKQAGVAVKVVLNNKFPVPIDDNQPTFTKLKNAGVPVVWAPPEFVYTHSKAIVIDSKEAWIMTMNTTQSSARENREFLMVDREPLDVAETQQTIEADFARMPAADTPHLVMAPVNARAKILGLIASATKSIDIEAQVLSDSDVVYQVIGKKRAKIAVRIVVSKDTLDQTSAAAALARLKREGIEVRALAEPSQHAKAIVVDGARAYVGSVNFTKNSMDNNREIGILFDDAAAVKTVADTFAADLRVATPQ
jgi:cardiolipin synthase A/B